MNEPRGSLNEHQSETDNTINREINELEKIMKNIKEEVSRIWKK
jgi:hypothetical protein